jgi:putative Mg2+ transporter-C (MgtC) family protein
VVIAAPQLATWEVALRLVAAAAIGAALGTEREWREQEAGVRTHMLVCLGAAMFTIVSAYGFVDFAVGRWDPTRIAAQIVTGIGFIGAGAILRGGGRIRGLTTAANLWVAAAAGMAAGAGAVAVALIGTVIALVALGPLRLATTLTIDRWRRRDARIAFEVAPTSLAAVLEALPEHDGGVHRIDVDLTDDRARLTVWADHQSGPRIAAIIDDADGR